MGGEGKGSASLQSIWDTNRRDNPYQFFMHDLLCDVTLTVSSGERPDIGTNITKVKDSTIEENVSPIHLVRPNQNIEKRSFKAHRLILACHSEYFHRMFISCGMREVTGEVNTKMPK